MNLSASSGAQVYDIGGLWGTNSAIGGKDWTWEAPVQNRVTSDITPSISDESKFTLQAYLWLRE